MKRSLFVLGAATAIVAGSVLATAQNPPAGAPAQGGGLHVHEPAPERGSDLPRARRMGATTIRFDYRVPSG